MRSSVLSGISSGFPELSRSCGQVAHVLLTRPPLTESRQAPIRSARLACIRHAASVRPEPGSNSPKKVDWLLLRPMRTSAFRIVQLRSAAARGQITFTFRVQAPLQAKNICPSRRPADLRFSSRFVSFSFQGTRPLLELTSLQSCAEESNSSGLPQTQMCFPLPKATLTS